MAAFLLDTKVFNAVLDGELATSVFGGREIFAAHVQWDELGDTNTPDRAW